VNGKEQEKQCRTVKRERTEGTARTLRRGNSPKERGYNAPRYPSPNMKTWHHSSPRYSLFYPKNRKNREHSSPRFHLKNRKNGEHSSPRFAKEQGRRGTTLRRVNTVLRGEEGPLCAELPLFFGRRVYTQGGKEVYTQGGKEVYTLRCT